MFRVIQIFTTAMVLHGFAVQAAVLNLGLSRQSGTTDLGTLQSYDGPAVDGTVTTGVFTFTISGLTIDTQGSADDTAIIAFTYNSVDGGIRGGGEFFGAQGSGNNRRFSEDQGLEVSFNAGASSVILGGGSIASTSIVFNGFSGANFRNVNNGDEFTLAGGAQVGGSNVIESNGFVNFDSLVSTFGGITTDGGNGVRINEITGSVSILPEPSSVMLICFGASALLFNRRRI